MEAVTEAAGWFLVIMVAVAVVEAVVDTLKERKRRK